MPPFFCYNHFIRTHGNFYFFPVSKISIREKVMNSRERILAALNHETPDRIPVDFGGTRTTGITAPAMYRLRQCLGIETPTRVYDVYVCLAEMDDAVADAVGSDVLRLPVPVPLLNIECLMDLTKKHWKPYALEDGTPTMIPNDFYPERELNGDLCLRDMQDRRFALLPRGGFQFSFPAKGPGAAGMTVDELNAEIEAKNPAVLVEKTSKYWEMLQLAASVFAKTSHKALILEAGPPSPFFAGLGRGDIPAWKARLKEKESGALAILEKWLEIWLASIPLLKTAVGSSVDVFVLEEDFSRIESQMGFQAVRETILPLYEKGIREIRQTISPDAKFLWQSSGNIEPLIPDLISIGVNALSLDMAVPGMNPANIRQDFGSKIALWGGVCSVETLRGKTPEEIMALSRDALYALSRGGGFILASSGNILPGTDPENVLTFFGKSDE